MRFAELPLVKGEESLHALFGRLLDQQVHGGWFLPRGFLLHNGVMVTLEMLRTGMRAEILRLAQRHGARELRVFGSVARGEAGPASDVDLLVEWEPGRSLLDHAGLALDLQDLLGAPVQIGTEGSLHWYVRDRILREAVPL